MRGGRKEDGVLLRSGEIKRDKGKEEGIKSSIKKLNKKVRRGIIKEEKKIGIG